VTLFVFWVWFLWPLKVVGYTSKASPDSPEQQSLDYRDNSADPIKLRPLGPLFLFDRLLPAYRILQRHYEIDQYYKRIPATKSASDVAQRGEITRFWLFRLEGEPITDLREVAWIETSLLFLRIFGVVFAIFLAAAVSTLVIR